MPTLDFDRAPAPKQPKKLRRLLEFGTITALLSIGVAYAIPAARNAIITLSGDNAVEFGQGVVTTAACDSNITITPSSDFANATDAKYLMSSIRISGIDLTPEGWDLSRLPQSWDVSESNVTPPIFAEGFNPNLNPELRSWDSEYEQHAGQYKKFDDTWANTCEGKVLQLRAYTNQSDYAQYTVSETSIDSPLWLNRMVSPATSGANAGVGVRFYYLPSSVTEADQAFVTDIFLNNGGISGRVNDDALYIESEWGVAYSDPTAAAVTIYFDDAYNLVPLDSRWVDKVTIESNAKKSTEWNPYHDWFAQLS